MPIVLSPWLATTLRTRRAAHCAAIDESPEWSLLLDGGAHAWLASSSDPDEICVRMQRLEGETSAIPPWGVRLIGGKLAFQFKLEFIDAQFGLGRVSDFHQPLAGLHRFAGPALGVGEHGDAVALGTHFAAFEQLTGIVPFGAFLLDARGQQVNLRTGLGIGKRALGIGLQFSFGNAQGAFGHIGLSLERGAFKAQQQVAGFHRLVGLDQELGDHPVQRRRDDPATQWHHFRRRQHRLAHRDRQPEQQQCKQSHLTLSGPTQSPGFA